MAPCKDLCFSTKQQALIHTVASLDWYEHLPDFPFVIFIFDMPVIDDKLPFHPQDNTMMCMSILPSPTSDFCTRKSLWPSLLEKAVSPCLGPAGHLFLILEIQYMKLMGGYDFPGS